MIDIDFQAARTKSGKTQAEVAELLGINQSQLCRYEQSPGNIPLSTALQLIQILGIDFVGLSEQQNQFFGIDPGSPYDDQNRYIQLLSEYIQTTEPTVELDDLPIQPPIPQNLKDLIELRNKKPNLVITGGFDTGKSHLANWAIGGKFLPSEYEPATKVITLVRHIEDRPSWFREDVMILDEGCWKKNEHGQSVIKLGLLDNADHCKDHTLRVGTVDTLRQYGVHKSKKTEVDAHSAVVYLDAPILKACNIIDLPGFFDQPDEDSEDSVKANLALNLADICIYTSMAKGHINGADMMRLSALLKILPIPEAEDPEFPLLGNICIVATQADPSIPKKKLNNISSGAAKRLFRTIEPSLQRRGEIGNVTYTGQDLEHTFHHFWSDTKDRYEDLRIRLVDLLSNQFPKYYLKRLSREINSLKDGSTKQLANMISDYQKTIDELETRKLEYLNLKSLEKERKKSLEKERKNILVKIKEIRDLSKNEFQERSEKLLNIDNLTQEIETKFADKKEAKNEAIGYILEKLNTQLEETIEKNSNILIPMVKSYLKEYEKPSQNLKQECSMDIAFSFDTNAAFLTGLTGLGVTSAGAISGVLVGAGTAGGHAVAAGAISILSNLGLISAGGQTAAILAAIGAIAGPITLGLSLAAAAAAFVWSIFGQSWQLTLAKKIVKTLKKKKIIENLNSALDTYWNDTELSFKTGADNVEEKWQQYLVHLKDITSPKIKSKKKVEELIHELDKLRIFFGGIPWGRVS